MSEALQAVDFGRYRLLPAERILAHDGVPVSLGSRAFDILQALLERSPDIVTKEELIRRVWGGFAVDDNTLAVHISALRKVLKEGKGEARYIGTVPGRGYRFLGKIEAAANPPIPPVEQAVLGNLPSAQDALIGRQTELAEITSAIRAHALVTLTGAGGIGKTRLALAAGEALRQTFPDGVWWVDLASVGEPDAVYDAIARALGLAGDDWHSAARLAARLRPQRRLLILDSCEHVAAAAAAFATELRGGEGLRLLTTSREPIGVSGEIVYRLPPLLVPSSESPSPAEALQAPAVQLFMARARALDPRFLLESSNVAPIVRVCRQLHGVPLALELAATRAALLGIKAVEERLDGQLLDISTRRRDVSVKHLTLRTLIDWSYENLSDAEQILLRRLAVLSGNFTLDAAEAVAADDLLPEWQIAELLACLINQSLVASERTASGMHYRLFATTQAYAREKLAETGELHVATRRKIDYLCGLVQHAVAQSDATASDQRGVQLWSELGNLRTTIDWCFSANEILVSVLNTIPFPVYVVDTNTYDIVLANPALRQSLGDDLSSPCYKALYGQKSPCLHCRIGALLTPAGMPGPQSVVSELFNEIDERWYQMHERCTTWLDGRIVKYAVAVDISALKQAQNRLAESHAELMLQSRGTAGLSNIDPLTQVWTRQRLQIELETEIERAQSTGTELAVILCHLNDLRRVNKSHGYAAGDALLAAAALSLRRTLRDTDLLGRWDGNEFLALLPETDKGAAEAVAEELRSAFASHEFSLSGAGTMAAGLACLHPDDTATTLMERAEDALTRNKPLARERAPGPVIGGHG